MEQILLQLLEFKMDISSMQLLTSRTHPLMTECRAYARSSIIYGSEPRPLLDDVGLKSRCLDRCVVFP